MTWAFVRLFVPSVGSFPLCSRAVYYGSVVSVAPYSGPQLVHANISGFDQEHKTHGRSDPWWSCCNQGAAEMPSTAGSQTSMAGSVGGSGEASEEGLAPPACCHCCAT